MVAEGPLGSSHCALTLHLPSFLLKALTMVVPSLLLQSQLKMSKVASEGKWLWAWWSLTYSESQGLLPVASVIMAMCVRLHNHSLKSVLVSTLVFCSRIKAVPDKPVSLAPTFPSDLPLALEKVPQQCGWMGFHEHWLASVGGFCCWLQVYDRAQ